MADSKNVVVDSTAEVVDTAEPKHEKVTPMPEQHTEAADEVVENTQAATDPEEQVIRHTSYSALPIAEIVRIIDRHDEAKPEFRDILVSMSNWMYDKKMETLDAVVDKFIGILKANISVHDIIVNMALLDTADMARQNGPIYGWQDAPVSIVYDNTIQYVLDSALNKDDNAQAAPFYALREVIRLIWLVKNRPDRMDLQMYNVTDESNNAEEAAPVEAEKADSEN